MGTTPRVTRRTRSPRNCGSQQTCGGGNSSPRVASMPAPIPQRLRAAHQCSAHPEAFEPDASFAEWESEAASLRGQAASHDRKAWTLDVRSRPEGGQAPAASLVLAQGRRASGQSADRLRRSRPRRHALHNTAHPRGRVCVASYGPPGRVRCDAAGRVEPRCRPRHRRRFRGEREQLVVAARNASCAAVRYRPAAAVLSRRHHSSVCFKPCSSGTDGEYPRSAFAFEMSACESRTSPARSGR